MLADAENKDNKNKDAKKGAEDKSKDTNKGTVATSDPIPFE